MRLSVLLDMKRRDVREAFKARLLVAQLQLLVQATGSERLMAHIVTTDDEAQAFRRVLAAISEQPGNQG